MIPHGKIIRNSDIVYKRVKKSMLISNVIDSKNYLIGKEARRNIKSGKPINIYDIEEPKMVERDSAVTVYYQIPGLNITIKGKALNDGVKGDIIDVINLRTKKIIKAKITAKSTARAISSN